MDFVVLGEIENCETFATNLSIRELACLRLAYGEGRWRKRKGFVRAEVHWYEAHGIGKKELRIKRLLEDDS